ncbi:hypothetical protein Leryth_008978 [Lithospermum erythrorhizon]|nr:hypothetical protein Leryth_008978 [Lithospermum erythrorhizon]
MNNSTTKLAKPIALFTITFSTTILLLIFSQTNPSSTLIKPKSMSSQSFIIWLHGLGDSGPANEPIKTIFTSDVFNHTKWSFPSASLNPVTCNNGAVMPSWFDIHEIPVTAHSPNDERSLLEAVNHVHAMIGKEIADGTDPSNIFVCGFSQGGALTLASVLLYPRTLGGGAVFSGWVPFNSSILGHVTPEAKQKLRNITNKRIRLVECGCDSPFGFGERLVGNGKLNAFLELYEMKLTCITFQSFEMYAPILWSHGTVDGVVLFEAGRAGPPFLEKAGMNCEFKAYPGLGHSINNDELKYLESWIKARLQSSP